MNPFLKVDAISYDAGRPNFHPIALKRFIERIGIQTADRALDVACGTGNSARALATMSRFIVGLDASPNMLAQARLRKGVWYVRGLAERLPFSDGSFNLMSVALGLHWFDRRAFLREAHRVLVDQSWLLIYDSGFCERMAGSVAFTDWLREYRARLPPPPRDVEPLAEDLLREVGFTTIMSEDFVHTQDYDLDELVGFVKTQSRVLHAVHESGDSAFGISTWLLSSLAAIVGSSKQTFEFEGWLHLLQKA